jgi:hypothetical protein
MFKQCKVCNQEWAIFNQFLDDKNLKFHGYQANPLHPEKGLFLFNHIDSSCKTTLAIKVEEFRDNMMKDAILKQFSKYGEGCPGYCDDKHNLQDCHNTLCNGHVVRELIQKIKEHLPT